MTRHRRSSFLSFLSVLSLVFLPLIGHAGTGTLTLEKRAAFGKGLTVPDTVRSDCQLESKIIEYIQAFAGEEFDKIELVDHVSADSPGRSLEVTITDLSSAGGGAWSGPKHLSIEGTLWQDGKVQGTFAASHVSSAGGWEGYKGTCSLLCRCARALGKDVAEWLKNPSMGSQLGASQ